MHAPTDMYLETHSSALPDPHDETPSFAAQKSRSGALGRRSRTGLYRSARRAAHERGLAGKGDGNSLAKDLISYFQNDCARDVYIKCGNTGYWANHVVLSARSPVFRVMLQKTYVEGKTNTVVVKDFPANLVSNFLEYVQSDTCEALREGSITTALDLFLLADKYEFSALMRSCENRIDALVTKDSVLTVLRYAEKTNSGFLKRRSMEVLQTVRGAELLCIMRGKDIWDDVRDMKVCVEAMAGADARQLLEVTLCAFDSVETLKQRISAAWSVAPESQKLVFTGTLLEDDKTVHESGLVEGSTVFMLEGTRKKEVVREDSEGSPGN